jgi:hypothetical protein
MKPRRGFSSTTFYRSMLYHNCEITLKLRQQLLIDHVPQVDVIP